MASKNIALINSIKAEGLQEEDHYLVNTFTWTLYQKFVESGEKESGQHDLRLDPSRTQRPTVLERSLNTILYGPPGTGKTYHTVNKALQIIDPVYYHEHKNDRGFLKSRFDDLVQQNRIGFVTFHQSFSYEDFVEGIRVETYDDGVIRYLVQDGIFKVLCLRAEEAIDVAGENDESDRKGPVVLIINEMPEGFDSSFLINPLFHHSPSCKDNHAVTHNSSHF